MKNIFARFIRRNRRAAMGHSGAGAQGLLWASTSNTFAAAGNASKTATLPGSAVGRPRMLRASGSVSGEVDIAVSNTQTLICPVNPNAPYTEIALPSYAFPTATGAVPVTLVADGAGVIRAVIGFAP